MNLQQGGHFAACLNFVSFLYTQRRLFIITWLQNWIGVKSKLIAIHHSLLNFKAEAKLPIKIVFMPGLNLFHTFCLFLKKKKKVLPFLGWVQGDSCALHALPPQSQSSQRVSFSSRGGQAWTVSDRFITTMINKVLMNKNTHLRKPQKGLLTINAWTRIRRLHTTGKSLNHIPINCFSFHFLKAFKLCNKESRKSHVWLQSWLQNSLHVNNDFFPEDRRSPLTTNSLTSLIFYF